MMEIDYKNALYQFERYVGLQQRAVFDEKLKLNGMYQKLLHSLSCVEYGRDVIRNLGFNTSFANLTKVAILDHDIGRFLQMHYLGTFKDSDLKKLEFFNVEHHGELGKKLLDAGILKQQIRNTRAYDECISTVVLNHVYYQSNYKDLLILVSDFFKDEHAYDVLTTCDDDTKRMIFAALTQIVQDIDRLDIYSQILEERFVPKKSDENVDPKILDMFYKGEYLNINEIKKQGLWNPNVGELVRLSFIDQIRLLSVAKTIQTHDMIEQMKIKRNNSKLADAFDFTEEKLNQMINNSKDGVTVNKVKKLTI